MKNNLTTYDLFDFSRLARQPDGRDVTVGFTLAFASVPELPEAMAFTCQQWRPDLFWKAEYQIHANSAERINEVFLIAEDPVPAETFIKGLGLDPIYGRVSVMSAIEFKKAGFQSIHLSGTISEKWNHLISKDLDQSFINQPIKLIQQDLITKIISIAKK